MPSIIINGITYDLKKIPETTHNATILDTDLIPFSSDSGTFYYMTYAEFKENQGIPSAKRVSGNYTILASDRTILAGAGGITITVPDPADNQLRTLTIANAWSGAVTLSVTGGSLIKSDLSAAGGVTGLVSTSNTNNASQTSFSKITIQAVDISGAGLWTWVVISN